MAVVQRSAVARVPREFEPPPLAVVCEKEGKSRGYGILGAQIRMGKLGEGRPGRRRARSCLPVLYVCRERERGKELREEEKKREGVK